MYNSSIDEKPKNRKERVHICIDTPENRFFRIKFPVLGPVQTSNFTCAEFNCYFSRLK